MFALLLVLTLYWLPRERVELTPERDGDLPIATGLGTLSVAALLAMVLLLEYGLALPGVLGVFALFARPSLARVDWLLLLTFAAIFLGLRHFAELPRVRPCLDRLDFNHPPVAYLSGILASQLISNVPATVLLLDRVHDSGLLAVAVNVGGFGLAIGSLANLIALRLAKLPHGLRLLHLASIPFLLVCAPLVYGVWWWLG